MSGPRILTAEEVLEMQTRVQVAVILAVAGLARAVAVAVETGNVDGVGQATAAVVRATVQETLKETDHVE